MNLTIFMFNSGYYDYYNHSRSRTFSNHITLWLLLYVDCTWKLLYHSNKILWWKLYIDHHWLNTILTKLSWVQLISCNVDDKFGVQYVMFKLINCWKLTPTKSKNKATIQASASTTKSHQKRTDALMFKIGIHQYILYWCLKLGKIVIFNMIYPTCLVPDYHGQHYK